MIARTARIEPFRVLCWLAVVAGVCAQGYMTAASMKQLRYEELAESVRNPFWLDEGAIYDGISSNVGWYGVLLVAYKVTGFTLYRAKLVRLVYGATGLSCLALVLSRRIGPRRALGPLLVAGLSPAWLYLNTLQTSYGMDLCYLPICLLILDSLFQRDGVLEMAGHLALGSVAMLAWMTYPPFVFSLLVLGLFYLRKWNRNGASKALFRWACGGLLLLGTLLPLGAALLYLHSPTMLLHDATVKSGIFRGGGGAGLAFAPRRWFDAWRQTLGDLFVSGQTYHIDLSDPDFSGPLGAGAAILLAGLAISLYRRSGQGRYWMHRIVVLLSLSLVVPCLSPAVPGLRRSTGLLVGTYGLLVLLWSFVGRTRDHPRFDRLVLLATLVLLVHHLTVLPKNREEIQQPSRYRMSAIYGYRVAPWFAMRSTPEASLRFLLRATSQGHVLGPPQNTHGPMLRYSEVYAALAGYRRWNGYEERPIRAVDPRTGQTLVLTTLLWERRLFPH